MTDIKFKVPIKAILINTPKRIIEETTYDGTLEDIYSKIGFGCTKFQSITLNGKWDTLYVYPIVVAQNLLATRADIRNARFSHKRYHSVMFCCGMVIGGNMLGESQEPHTDIETLQREIKFL